MPSTRKAPLQSATIFNEGTVKKGEDGGKWIIAISSSGVKRWKKDLSRCTTRLSRRTTRKTKTKSKRLASLKKLRLCNQSHHSVKGKNKLLEKFWYRIHPESKNAQVVLIFKNKDYKFHKLPKTPRMVTLEYEKLENDRNIEAILSSGRSWDNYEGHLYPLAKNKTVDAVISNYKKYFKLINKDYSKKVRIPVNKDF